MLRSCIQTLPFIFVHLLPGRFSVQNVAPQPDGDSSKVKVKVRVNVHGIFSVSSASLIEKQKGEGEEMQIDSEPMVQNESRAEDQVRWLLQQSLLWRQSQPGHSRQFASVLITHFDLN